MKQKIVKLGMLLILSAFVPTVIAGSRNMAYAEEQTETPSGNPETEPTEETETEPAEEPVEEPEEESNIVDYGIPILSLSLNGTTLETINNGSKDEKYEGNTLELIDGEESKSYENVEIKGRGNSTWNMAKKPYQIKFASKENLFGLGKAKKWVLLANYADASLMRNDIAQSYAQAVGMTYDLRGTWVDLWVDGEYAGNYYLCHKVEIGSSVVDLTNESGIIVENDMSSRVEEEESYRVSSEDEYLVLKESNNGNLQEAAMDDFLAAYNGAMADLDAGDWEAACEKIDVESFAQYYAVQEAVWNSDAFTTSCYYYKDGPDDVIHAGPCWDYDVSFGNVGSVISGVPGYASAEQSINRNYLRGMYLKLANYPEFYNMVKEIYRNQLRDAMVNAPVEENAEYLARSGAANNELWGKASFADQAAALRSWIDRRIAYMDFYYDEESNVTLADGFVTITSYHGMISHAYLKRLGDGTYQIMNSDGVLKNMTTDNMMSPGDTAIFTAVTEDRFYNRYRWYAKQIAGATYLVSKYNGMVLALNGSSLTTEYYNCGSSSVMLNVIYAQDALYTDVTDRTEWYYDVVKKMKELGLMTGYGNGLTFGVMDSLTREQVLSILYRMAGSPETAFVNAFLDVREGDWYEKAVSWAYSSGIVSGYSDGTVGVGRSITREELICFLYRYAKSEGKDVTGGSLERFSDAGDVNSWAYEAVSWAAKSSILTGNNGRILPGNNASRAEAAALFSRFCDFMEL